MVFGAERYKMKTFEQWMNETWEFLILEGSGRMIWSTDEWVNALKEAWEDGYKQCDIDSLDALEEQLKDFSKLQHKQ